MIYDIFDTDQFSWICALELWIQFWLQRHIRIRIEVWWIYNTVLNRAGFESGYGSEAGNGFFFFMQMLFWIMILRNRFFFWFFALEYIWYTKFWAASKKIQPPACLGHRLHLLAFFFSPRNRASKMRERHQLFFGLQLLVSKEFRHLANKNRAALWRTLKFWNPSHATVPFSKKSSPFYEMKNLFFLQIYS